MSSEVSFTNTVFCFLGTPEFQWSIYCKSNTPPLFFILSMDTDFLVRSSSTLENTRKTLSLLNTIYFKTPLLSPEMPNKKQIAPDTLASATSPQETSVKNNPEIVPFSSGTSNNGGIPNATLSTNLSLVIPHTNHISTTVLDITKKPLLLLNAEDGKHMGVF